MFVWRAFDALSPRELHDLLRLRGDVFVVEQNCAFPEIDGRDPQALHLLARTERGDLAGTLRLFAPADRGPARIGRVATALPARGRGLGRAMMDEGIAESRRRFGAAPIEIGAQSAMEGFYRSLGFARTSADYDEDGIPHCAMVRVDPG